MKNSSPFEFLDFTEEEAKAAVERKEKEERHKDGRICACGHPVGRHEFVPGLGSYSCSAGKNNCPCKKLRAVIEVDNARIFLRKTTGAGPLHALGHGIIKAVESGQTIRWLIEQKCDRCEKEAKLTPVAVNARGAVMTEATGLDALVCSDCRTEI
jgi:hypothetical protein